MTDVPALLWATLRLRPYVFCFLAVHAWSAIRALGIRRAAALMGIVWVMAFAAEWTSTRAGFPFGLYTYTEATRGQELVLGNIPFMDSLSFTFLAWASYAVALGLAQGERRPDEGGGGGGRLPVALRTAPGTLACAVVCFVAIDVIIDPLAVRGDRWFLGRIFSYPHGGAYFGVPLSNFAGWAAVGAFGLALYAVLDRRWELRGLSLPAHGPAALRWGAALWFAVAVFNLLITFAIGEVALGAAGLSVAGALAGLLALRQAGALAGRDARAWQRETSLP